MNQRYAAIDQGTTGTRVVVFGEDGRHHSPASMPHKQITPIRAGWNTTPWRFWRISPLSQPVRHGGRHRFRHQGESLLAWDADSGLPLYNAIVWQDQRTEPEIQRLKREGVEPLVMAKTGLPLDTYFSASKMGWLMNTRRGPGSWRNAVACGSAPWTPSSCFTCAAGISPTITRPRAPRCSTFIPCSGTRSCAVCSACRSTACRGQRQHRPLRRRRAQRQTGAADGLHRRPVCPVHTATAAINRGR